MAEKFGRIGNPWGCDKMIEKEYKIIAKLSEINTTTGKRYLIVTNAKSKEFKTLKGAERWAIKNNYKIERV